MHVFFGTRDEFHTCALNDWIDAGLPVYGAHHGRVFLVADRDAFLENHN
jgi:hypothetical protein